MLGGQNFGLTTKDLTGRLVRWALELQDFNFVYRPGHANADTDGLSRLPADDELIIHVCATDFSEDDHRRASIQRTWLHLPPIPNRLENSEQQLQISTLGSSGRAPNA